jgi:hypothetical protein
MRRTLSLLSLLAVASWGAACGGGDSNATNGNANNGNGNATRNGVVETNANVPKNLNANSAPSNVGVLTNDNGNKNTDGVRPINDNGNHAANGNKNANGSRNANGVANRNGNH